LQGFQLRIYFAIVHDDINDKSGLVKRVLNISSYFKEASKGAIYSIYIIILSMMFESNY